MRDPDNEGVQTIQLFRPLWQISDTPSIVARTVELQTGMGRTAVRELLVNPTCTRGGRSVVFVKGVEPVCLASKVDTAQT